jgi:hypothetical protein
VARRFIDKVTPSDRVAIVFSQSGRNQNFTNDRARLCSNRGDEVRSALHLGGWRPRLIPTRLWFVELSRALGARRDRRPLLHSQRASTRRHQGHTDPDIIYRQASIQTLRQVAETLISSPQRRKARLHQSRRRH